MVKKILLKFKPKKNDLIIDIGCNDGITLDLYPKKKYSLLGIEPSSAYYYAKKKKLNVKKKFFNFKISQNIKKKNCKSKIITATNVFAHNHDINDFTKGIKNLLKKDTGGICGGVSLYKRYAEIYILIQFIMNIYLILR